MYAPKTTTSFLSAEKLPKNASASSSGASSSSTNSTPATSTVVERQKKPGGNKKKPPASPPPKKARKAVIDANKDGFHESHQNARVGIHYRLVRFGCYTCIRPELKAPHDAKPACVFTVTNPDRQKAQASIANHVRMCWPNLLEKKRGSELDRQKLNPNSSRKNSSSYAMRQRNNIFSMMTLGVTPTLTCSVEGCEILSYTPFDLRIHVGNAHDRDKERASISAFFDRDEWKIDLNTPSPEDAKKHDEFKEALKNYIITSVNGRATRFYAYVVLFFPEVITTVETAWTYLENGENETRILPYYAGRATVPWVEFNAEKYHTSEYRNQSTVLDFIRETGCRAFQLCALQFDTLDESTDQESIFQLYGWSSRTTKTLRQDKINFSLINVRPEGKNWLKLAYEDFNLAVDQGRARTALVCPTWNCGVSHKVRGKCFGQLNRNEVKLIPFDFHV